MVTEDLDSLLDNASHENRNHLARYVWAGDQFNGGVIVDIGSEFGYGSRALERDDRSILNLDINLDTLIFTKNRCKPNEGRFYLCGDAQEIPLPDNCCRGVCLINLLHLASSPDRLLAECRRILQENYPLVISIPTDYNLPDEWRLPSEKIILEQLLRNHFGPPAFWLPSSRKNSTDDSVENVLTAVCIKT